MTDRWFLSKDAMKGLDLVSVCINTLFAIEQAGEEKKVLSEEELQNNMARGELLFKKLRVAAEGQIEKGVEVDPVIFRLVDELRKELRVTPSQLVKKLMRAEDDLNRAQASEETVKLLEKISDIAKSWTEKKVAALSSSIH